MYIIYCIIKKNSSTIMIIVKFCLKKTKYKMNTYILKHYLITYLFIHIDYLSCLSYCTVHSFISYKVK